jgi:hypothetical protein
MVSSGHGPAENPVMIPCFSVDDKGRDASIKSRRCYLRKVSGYGKIQGTNFIYTDNRRYKDI